MANRVTESSLYEVVSQIKHPEIQNRNLVELGMISEIKISSNHVTLTLALPSPGLPIKDTLINEIKKSITHYENGLTVKVDSVEMNDDQRSTFFSLLREEQSSKKPSGFVRKILAVMSGKGGVGKSSVAGLLASYLCRRELQVGVLDADITGPSIPKMFGTNDVPIAGENGILPVMSALGIKIMSVNLLLPDKDQPVVWRGPLIGRAIQQFWTDIEWGELDFLIVDLPPGTSDAALTVMQSLPLDGVLLVTSPQDLAGMIVRKAANMAKQLAVPIIGIVENMSYMICPGCGHHINLFGTSRSEETANKLNLPLLGKIPLDTQLSILCDGGKIESYENKFFEDVANRILHEINSKERLSKT
jgi:Mrp family chromosome partitioning ATPase